MSSGVPAKERDVIDDANTNQYPFKEPATDFVPRFLRIHGSERPAHRPRQCDEQQPAGRDGPPCSMPPLDAWDWTGPSILGRSMISIGRVGNR